MIDFGYLYQGICGLANAHKAGTMAGHLGAAVAAGYFFGEERNELPAEVLDGIQREMDRVIAGEESIWFNAKKAGVTPAELFNTFPGVAPEPDSIDSIVSTLRNNVGSLRQSGHNVIFASIAVRALVDHPDYATAPIVDGMRRLIAAFDHVSPGRGYYGKHRGWMTGNQVQLSDQDSFPTYASIQQMVDVTVTELIESAGTKKQGFGGLWHIINHAAAITELDRYGYRSVARRALPAHHQHMRLWRTLPNVEDELGAVIKSEKDPCDSQYWRGQLKRDEARLTHRIKTLYGFSILRRLIGDEDTRQQADNALLYLMADLASEWEPRLIGIEPGPVCHRPRNFRK